MIHALRPNFDPIFSYLYSYCFLFQVSYAIRKKGIRGGRFKNWSRPKARKRKVHYWAAVVGGTKLLGPFFYEKEKGKKLMDGVAHLKYVF